MLLSENRSYQLTSYLRYCYLFEKYLSRTLVDNKDSETTAFLRPFIWNNFLPSLVRPA